VRHVFPLQVLHAHTLDFSLAVVADAEQTTLQAIMDAPSMIRTFEAFNRDLARLNDCGMFHSFLLRLSTSL
jgi:hypothetical protein